MRGICKLCKKEAKLEESHFIPKFIGKWVKKTSITGYLREKNQVHKRAQDIAKEYWLCGECEDLFSSWETAFANKIFHPFVNGKTSMAHYDSWMSMFCASLTWRTLTYIRSKNIRDEDRAEYNFALDNAENHLGNYLLGKTNNLNQYEQHIFPLESIKSTTESRLPPNINRYFLRTMAMDIIGNSTDLFIYTKLPSFMVLGLINGSEPKKMRNSRVALKSGKISPREYWWPDGFINYVAGKAEEITETHQKIPANQLKKIEELALRNPEKTVSTKQFKAFLHDYEQFGDDVFSK